MHLTKEEHSVLKALFQEKQRLELLHAAVTNQFSTYMNGVTDRLKIPIEDRNRVNVDLHGGVVSLQAKEPKT